MKCLRNVLMVAGLLFTLPLYANEVSTIVVKSVQATAQLGGGVVIMPDVGSTGFCTSSPIITNYNIYNSSSFSFTSEDGLQRMLDRVLSVATAAKVAGNQVEVETLAGSCFGVVSIKLLD